MPPISECSPPDTVGAPENDTLDTADDETAAEFPPARLVVWEGSRLRGDLCLVAGGAWAYGQCVTMIFEEPGADGVEIYWYPTLNKDAYEAVDPDTVEADYWERLDTGGPWGIYNYLVFYHFDEAEGPETQLEAMREPIDYAVRSVFTYFTDWVYFPHRYDVAWSEYPDIIAVTRHLPPWENNAPCCSTPTPNSGERWDGNSRI